MYEQDQFSSSVQLSMKKFYNLEACSLLVYPLSNILKLPHTACRIEQHKLTHPSAASTMYVA